MDLAVLRPLYEHPGPWSSVYLDTSRGADDAVAAVPLRWRAVKEKLAADGADPATIAAIERSVDAGPAGRPADQRGLAVFASAGEVRLVIALPVPPPRDRGVVAALPDPLGLVLTVDERVPWLRVVVDRTGADLLAVDAGGARRTAEVTGDAEYPLRKTQPGGWSQPRYQRAAEENWERNADQVSRAVVDLAEDVRAEVLVLAGDVRARQLVRDRLPTRIGERVTETETGARAAGAATGPLDRVTEAAVRARAGEHRDELLDAYHRDLGTGAAVAGLHEVAAALRGGGVRVLLLDRDRLPQVSVWAAADPRQLGIERAEVTAGEPFRVAAPSALVRAAISERAAVLAVTAAEIDLPDGVGAVLRYAQPAGS
jgi:hypothetical protein